MSLLLNLVPAELIRRLVKTWQPRGCKREKDYLRSLAQHLEKELPKEKIEKEYAIGRQRFDIVINEKIPIEIKYNLKSSSDLLRAKGQLSVYLKKFDFVFLVLCGYVDPSFLKELEEDVKETKGMWGERIFILVKK